MKAWIYALISGLPSFLTAPIRAVADRIYGVFHDAVRFAQWIKGGVKHLRDRAVYFVTEFKSLASEVYATAYYIIRIHIPLYVAGLVNQGIKYVERKISALRDSLYSFISSVADSILGYAISVRNWANGLINNLTKRLNSLISSYLKVQSLVVMLLTDPKQFAKWASAAIVSSIWSYFYDRRETILRLILRGSPALTAAIARELTRMIGKLL